MAWQFVECGEGGAALEYHGLQTNHTAYITRSEAKGWIQLTPESPGDKPALRQLALARISTGASHVKLEALARVAVHPAAPTTDNVATSEPEQYVLNHGCNKSEIIFLRPGDMVSFPEAEVPGTLTVKYNPSVVQVNSSVAADAEVPDSEDQDVVHQTKVAPERTESPAPSETDDEDLNDTVTDSMVRPIGTRSEATPAPSVPRTEIVQETPTAHRFIAATEVQLKASQSNHGLEATIVALTEAAAVLDSSSQKSNKEIPPILKGLAEVAIRQYEEPVQPFLSSEPEATPPSANVSNGSPRNDNEDHSAEPAAAEASYQSIFGPPNPPSRLKRKRGDDAVSASPVVRIPKRLKSSEKELSTPQRIIIRGVDTDRSQSAKSAKNENSMDDAVKEATPRSSLGSSVGDSELWEGDPPVVAFSNSALPEKTQLMKFLKSRGGSTVEAVEKSGCNLLCVQEGPLRKSLKLLSCLALGIPIVTDKWLSASARKKCLLSPKAYIPKVPEQEKEWGFSFSDVWGVPQDKVLSGLSIFFTPAAKSAYSDFAEVESLCRVAGAKKVEVKTAAVIIKRRLHEASGAVFLGQDGDDADVEGLLKESVTLYTRDLLTLSILRGKVDLDSDEFKITSGAKGKAKKPATTTGTRRGRPPKKQ